MGCPLVQGGILGTRSAKGTAAPASCTDDFQAAGGRPPPDPRIWLHLWFSLLQHLPSGFAEQSKETSLALVLCALSHRLPQTSPYALPATCGQHATAKRSISRPTCFRSSHLPTARYPACCRTTQTSAGASCAGRDVSRETMPILAPLWDQCQATLTLRFVPASLMSLTARRAVTLVA